MTDSPPVAVLTIETATGGVLRASTGAALQIQSDAGPLAPSPFLAGVDVAADLDLFGLAASTLTQATAEILDPDGLLSGPLGAMGANGEIALCWPGERWEDRDRVLAGPLAAFDSPPLDMPGAPVRVVLEAAAPATSEAFGRGFDLGTAWPAPLLDLAGADITPLDGVTAPYVLGRPRSVPAFKVGAVGASNRLVLCAHWLVDTGPIELFEDGQSIGMFTPSNGTTAAGDAYAYVDDPGWFTAASGAYTWSAVNGGLPAHDGVTRAALSAADVVGVLLTVAGVAVDWPHTAPALARLRDWPIGLFVNSEAPAVTILREHLIAYLPIVETTGPDGMILVWAAPHLDPVEGHLTWGQELTARVDRMSTSRTDDVRNQFVINYGRDGLTGDTGRAVRLDGSTSTLCYLSQQLYGVRAESPLTVAACQDESTALRIAAHRASRLALPRRAVSYALAADAPRLPVGAVVRLTDPGYALDGVRAVLRSIGLSGPVRVAGFDILDRTWASIDG